MMKLFNLKKAILIALGLSQVLVFANHNRDTTIDLNNGRGGFGQSGKQKIVLQYNGQEFRGHNTLFLKKEILMQSNKNITGAKIVAIKIIGKSRRGRGAAILSVSGTQSYAYNLNGNPQDFYSRENYTYDRVRINNPSYSSHGRWQVIFKGNIRLKKVVVILANDYDDRNNYSQKVDLQLYGQVFKGHSIFPLKRQLQMKYPHINFQNKMIKNVTVYAKSKHGNGTICLQVGQNISYEQYVAGNEYDFHNQSPYTFNRIQLKNNSNQNNYQFEQWQLLMQGKIKINNIVVTISSKNTPF